MSAASSSKAISRCSHLSLLNLHRIHFNECIVFLDSVIPALAELEVAYKEAMADPAFQVRHRNAACCHA